MTAPVIRNQNQVNVFQRKVLIDTLAAASAFILAPGAQCFSLLFDVPAGVTVSLMLGQQYEIPLQVGRSCYDMTTDGCPYLGGISLLTAVTYPPGTFVRVTVGGGVQTT